jgi:DNA-binding CsgD family transcriptional regulator/tetratricopeptide (TPR) repeat protein
VDGVGAPAAIDVTGAVEPHRFVTTLLRDLPRSGPTILVLEDVHWADEATMDVIRLLARQVASVPLLVVVTYRDDALEMTHPLRILVGDLGTDRSVHRMRLRPLSRDAVSQLAAPHGVDTDDLYRKSGGNPFFVIQTLEAGGEGVPDTIRDLVLARAGRLGARARSLLETISILPSGADGWLLRAVAGDVVDTLEECATSGLITIGPTAVTFRHELARLAIEETVAPSRKVELHRATLAALTARPGEPVDATVLAHHAEAAYDAVAVRRWAPIAARVAGARAAHREAAAQYARALRFDDGDQPEARAEMLELRAHECFLTDEYAEGVAALEEALALWRHAAAQVRQGDVLRQLSEFYWCPGRTAEAERAATEAVSVLEELPPTIELARAYVNLAALCMTAARRSEAVTWAERGRKLADEFDDRELALHAAAVIGRCSDVPLLEEVLAEATAADHTDLVGETYTMLTADGVYDHAYGLEHYIEEGLAYCSERGLELYRLYLLSARARRELDHGSWSDAAETAAAVLRIPRSSTFPRIKALVVLGLVRARRGDPGHHALLDEAWELAAPTGELSRLGQVAAARAEASWLQGDLAAVGPATEEAFRLAIARGESWMVGGLALLRRRAGIPVDGVNLSGAAPYEHALAGDAHATAAAWNEIGCPYEAALAWIDAGEDLDDAAAKEGLATLQRLGAKPAAAVLARTLRERGVRGLPRGPRPSTAADPSGLTPREVEVLGLIVEGHRNAEIARRLVLSRKTVDHHVSAVLRKLEVSSRGEATAKAARLGLVLGPEGRIAPT